MKPRTPKRRPGRPRKATHAPRFQVSVSRATYRLVQGAAISRGMTMVAVVEEACRGVGDDCCDCVAERAGI